MTDSKNSAATLALVPTSIAEAQSLARLYAQSSLMPEALRGKEPDVFVTIMAGLELGLAPMTSLRLINVIKGKPTISADGMVALVRASGKCEYFQCLESSEERATFETKRLDSPMKRTLSFSIEEAKKAGLLAKENWQAYPAAMLRSRAKAALCRDEYQDVLAGVYDPEELVPVPPSLSEHGERMAAEIGEKLSVEDLEALGREIADMAAGDRQLLRPIYREQLDALRARMADAIDVEAEEVVEDKDELLRNGWVGDR